jgi:hypothetical protein
MHTIYRIEHKTEKRNNGIGYGPYNTVGSNINRNYSWIDNMLIKHSDDNHPSMRVDCIDLSNLCNFYCAFESIIALKKWFKGFLTHLKKNNFVIVKYEVSEYVNSFSNLQLFFDFRNVISLELV